MASEHDGSLEHEVERYCPTCDQSFREDAIHCPDDGTKLVRLSPSVDPLLGRIIDKRFRVKKRIGAGGMGTVYLAFQGSVGRDVAIKVIESRLSQGKAAAKRFLREAKLSSRLSQPNIVTVLDFGQTDDGLLYLVMELLKGRTLQRVLRDAGRFPIKRMVRIGVQLCDALEAAHSRSIIHRDLKPTNVVVLDEPGGRDYLKVLDFGLAKSLAGDDSHTTVTKSDAILGTPGYISPEAVTGQSTDERTDLYSVGVMLYELVAGRLPFSASNINVMIAKHANDPPEPLPDDVHPQVSRVLMRLLAKDPADRYQTASLLRDDLMALPSRVGDPMTTGTRRQLERPEDLEGGDGDPNHDVALDETLASGSDAHAVTVATPRSSMDLRRPAQRSRLPWLGGGVLLAGVAALAIYFGVFAKDDTRTEPAPVADPTGSTGDGVDPQNLANDPGETKDSPDNATDDSTGNGTAPGNGSLGPGSPGRILNNRDDNAIGEATRNPPAARMSVGRPDPGTIADVERAAPGRGTKSPRPEHKVRRPVNESRQRHASDTEPSTRAPASPAARNVAGGAKRVESKNKKHGPRETDDDTANKNDRPPPRFDR